MKLITKETDYAIRALMCLALNNSRYRSAREISDKDGIPYQFLRRIFNALSERGIVMTKEGKEGGVKLKVKTSQIRVADIMKIFQGDLQLSACMFRGNICSNRRTCVLRKRIRSIEKVVDKEFKDITIASLVSDVEKG